MNRHKCKFDTYLVVTHSNIRMKKITHSESIKLEGHKSKRYDNLMELIFYMISFKSFDLHLLHYWQGPRWASEGGARESRVMNGA